MRDLNHDFKRLCQRNRDGAFTTQHDREVMLSLVADQLHEGAFNTCGRKACAASTSSIWCCAGIDRVHGLRHGYAQALYWELTGWKAPAAGGPPSKGLSPEQKRVDREARLAISREQGHEREQITAVYLGR